MKNRMSVGLRPTDMGLKQSATFGPFMGQTVVSALIAGMAGYHKVVRPVCPSATKRDNVVNMISSFFFFQISLAPIAPVLLSFQLNQDILLREFARSLFLASVAVTHFCAPLLFDVFSLSVYTCASIDMRSVSTLPLTCICASMLFSKLIIFPLLLKNARPSLIIRVIERSFSSVATFPAHRLQAVRHILSSGKVLCCGWLLHTTLDTLQRFRGRQYWTFGLSILLRLLPAGFAINCKSIRLALIGEEVFFCCRIILSTCRTPLISICHRCYRRAFTCTLLFSYLAKTRFTSGGIVVVSRPIEVKVSQGLFLLASGTNFQYNITHGKAPFMPLSSRLWMFPHRRGTNIYTSDYSINPLLKQVYAIFFANLSNWTQALG